MEIKGSISGIGDHETRNNEITADFLSAERNFIIGYSDILKNDAGGVIKDLYHDFDCDISLDNPNQITITDGICFAYGYIGYSDKIIIDIFPPPVIQYNFVYAEFNRSILPNAFEIKIMNNQSSPYWDSLFRQDMLSSVKTGIFQLPLWRVKMTSSGAEKIDDIRSLRSGISNVYNSYKTSTVAKNGTIHGLTTCVTPAINDYSDKVVNTEYVITNIQNIFDY